MAQQQSGPSLVEPQHWHACCTPLKEILSAYLFVLSVFASLVLLLMVVMTTSRIGMDGVNWLAEKILVKLLVN